MTTFNSNPDRLNSLRIPPDMVLLQNLDERILNLVADSRHIKPGDTFVAYPGDSADGRNYIPQAIAAGANAVIWESDRFAWDPSWKIANFPVENLSQKVGWIAKEIYGDPSNRVWVIGVTGTNGKTSITQWLAHCFAATETRTAIIGTIGNGFINQLTAGSHTTPDAITLQRLIAEFVKQGAHTLAMEVSSHALTQGRVNGIDFDVAIFSNLTRDHLDYHKDMQCYGQAKALLFDAPGLEHAVINLDDPFGRQLVEKLADSNLNIIGYSIAEQFNYPKQKNLHALYAEQLSLQPDGMSFKAVTPWGDIAIQSQLLGRFNASNLLAVLAGLLASGVSMQQAAQGIAELKPVTGRLQKLGTEATATVIIDYAHTPDALENVLITLRELIPVPPQGKVFQHANSFKATQLADGKLICVFGCGGDRDPGKRPMMGEIAARYADEVVITSDNPRSEDPHAIISDIAAGIPTAAYHAMEDRAAAIAWAIESSRPGDIVLIAGKGHELYQEIKGVKHPFNDEKIATAVLDRKLRAVQPEAS